MKTIRNKKNIRRIIVLVLILLAGICVCIYIAYRYREFYHSPEQVQKRQDALYSAQRDALAEERKLVAADAEDNAQEDLELYYDDYPIELISVTSDFSKEKECYTWTDRALVTLHAPEYWSGLDEWDKYYAMNRVADQVEDSMHNAALSSLPAGFEENYEAITDDTDSLLCYQLPVKYTKLVDLTVQDKAAPRRITLTYDKDSYAKAAYYIDGEEQDLDALYTDMYEAEHGKESGSGDSSTVSTEPDRASDGSSESRGAIRPTASAEGDSAAPSESAKTTPSTTNEDEYHVNDYDDPEDFYEDNADDFEDEEDAEDYYDEYHE